jgi:hypothetical protein
MTARRLFSFAITGAILLAWAVQAYGRPNFTGRWTLLPDQSDFGPVPPPAALTLTISHNEPNLRVVTAQARAQGDLEYEANYVTDGRECLNKVGDVEAKSTLTWDGDALASTTRMDLGGKAMTVTSRWTLSDDRKTLAMKSHFATAQGEFDTVQMFALQK